MRLLVSVRTAAEARTAIAGGADIIDAKDPAAGALGAVTLHVLREICDAVAGARPVTAAVGDATNPVAAERAASARAGAGIEFVKIGFFNPAHIRELLAAAVRGAPVGTGVVAVVYADRPDAMAIDAQVDFAASSGASGVLIDTVDKRGPGLCRLIDRPSLARLVATAHNRGLFVALAGKLSARDLPSILETGADIAGVRGAACDGERTGRISREKVELLAALARGEQAADLAGRDARRGHAGW